jgi:hypothetical protein
VLQGSTDKDKIRRLRGEIRAQHESIMELVSECALRFNRIPPRIARTLTDSASLLLEEQPAARRTVRDRMLRLLAPDEDNTTVVACAARRGRRFDSPPETL